MSSRVAKTGLQVKACLPLIPESFVKAVEHMADLTSSRISKIPLAKQQMALGKQARASLERSLEVAVVMQGKKSDTSYASLIFLWLIRLDVLV